MRQMKDSGIEWIGTIPENWICCKQKYAIQLINGRAYSDNEFEEDGKYKVLRVGNLFSNPTWYTSSLELPDEKYCDKGDLLYSWSMSYAPVIWQGEKVIYHYHIWKTRLSPELDKTFAYYYLISLTDSLRAEIHETTMGFITMGIMNDSYIAFPELSEQRKIAAYLDKKCSEINSLTADIQKQIETLEEYKRSVITEAVTKGLDPYVEKKDSGVEWIGEIPANWKTIRIGKLFRLREERNNRPLEEVQLLSLYTDIGVFPHGEQEERGNKAVTADGYKIVKKNDIVVNIILAWMGAIGISNYDGVTSPAYDVYIPDLTKVIPHYFHYIFRTPGIAGECYKYGRGIMAMRWRTYSTEFKRIFVPYPNIDEQKKIAAYLDRKCSEIDSIIKEKQQQLETLAEYKKSLIYEYVTGKKEVL